MNSQQSIIEKIVGDANEAAREALSKAEAEKDAILADAKFAASARISYASAGLSAVADDTINRRKTVAELDARKKLLEGKKRLLNETFSKALEKVCATDDKKYLSLVEDMLAHADDGDTVIISERDKGVITAAFVKKCAEKRGVKLALSQGFGDFSRGVVLAGANCDKNLTFDSEMERLKESAEPEVAAILFGGGDGD